MSRALIQVANQSTQAVSVDGTINLGTIVRRFGCACQLAGNAVQISSPGYYPVDASITIEPTATGAVTVALYKDDLPIKGATASTYAGTASEPVNLSISTTERIGCACDGISNLTLVLIEGPGNVTNVSMRVEKA